MWGIWCYDEHGWLRELPSKVHDGGEAVLAFLSKQKACNRAALHYSYESYTAAKRTGRCEVLLLTTLEECLP
jgi:hypothetical protein